MSSSQGICNPVEEYTHTWKKREHEQMLKLKNIGVQRRKGAICGAF